MLQKKTITVSTDLRLAMVKDLVRVHDNAIIKDIWLLCDIRILQDKV